MWESLVNPPDLESGDRRFKSSHLDHFFKEGNMPLTAKGKKIKKAMKKTYGSKKGESVFYAMENSGKLKGAAKKKKKK